MATKKTPKQKKEENIGKFLEFCIDKYQDDFLGFATDICCITPSNQQEEAMRLFVNGKGRLAIKSGHGTGKSCLLSVAAIWFLCCHPFAEVRITAPSSNQLYSTMMKEIRLWYERGHVKDFDLFIFTKDTIRLNHDKYSNNWFAKAVSVANPENISGAHAENLLIIVDEAAGVEDEVFHRLDGALTTSNNKLLMAANPSFVSGYFYNIFNNDKFANQFDLLTFNSEESSNVDPEFIEYMRGKYGQNSNIYKVRVLGEFAALDEETIVSRGDVKVALARLEANSESNRLYIGVDVASGMGNDSSVISIRKGDTELKRFKRKVKLGQLFEEIKDIVDANKRRYDLVIVNADTTGLGIQLGQDLFDEYCTDTKVEINQINFSNRASDSKVYGNIFTEMFFSFSEKIKNIKLYDELDESTVEEELGSRRFGYDVYGRFVAEKKEAFIKRIGHSPDEGDAVLLAFYEPEDSTMVIGRLD